MPEENKPKSSGGTEFIRRVTNQRLSIQWDVSRVLSESDQLLEALTEVIQSVCENLGWQAGELWQVERDHLKCVDMWHMPDVGIPEFMEATRQLNLAPGEDLPGRIWLQCQPAWVPDISQGDFSPRAGIAAREGLRGACGFPVLAQGGVWGVMSFLSRKTEEPDPSLLRTFAALGNQLGQFVVRRAAEDALHETSALQKAILASTNYSIISTAPNGLIRTFNAAAERLLGYRAEEVIGKMTPSILHEPAEIRARAEVLSRALGRRIEPGFEVFTARAALGAPDEQEWTYVRKDGTRFPVLLSVTALFDDIRNITGFVGVASDITERKRVADELVKAKEAAEFANRAKTSFLAVISHEIRTPMNGVLGMVDLLLDTPLDQQQIEYARTIAHSGEALLEIINDLLDFSKIEAGEELALHPESFSLRNLAEGVMKLLQPRVQSRGISLVLEVDSAVPDGLQGDAGRLRQILVNLVGNGVKFTTQGSVYLRICPAQGLASAVGLRFEILDTGIGIEPADIGRLFQPFSQVDSSASRRRGGTGLGLAISKRIVEMMGGRIGVESELGAGSMFWFEVGFGLASPGGTLAAVRIPVEAPSDFRPANPPTSERPMHRILLAEDQETNRRLATYMLERLGLRPEYAADGREAVSAWERNRYDVILMDCQMPDKDGFEATREIRQREEARKLPREGRVRIVALTANALSGDREKCLAAGMDGYLSKPFSLVQLRDALANVGLPSQISTPEQELPTAPVGVMLPSVVSPTPTPALPPPSKFFDPDRPAQLCSELGDEAVEEVIADFLKDLPARSAELQTLMAAARWAELGRLAHSLQGIGFSFGLIGLGRQLQTLEQGAQNSDQRRMDVAMCLLPGLLAESESALRNWLQQKHLRALKSPAERPS